MPATQTYALFGAAPDTANRGVSALFRCAVEGIATAFPRDELVVFDNDLGVRTDSVTLQDGARYTFSRIGGRGGKRYYLPENLATMAAVSSLGALGGLHPYVRLIDRCSAVLDVSGGDSFSDIYGSHRFWSIVRPKFIAKRRGVPLILLPQTYGPFKGRRARELAREAVIATKMAWARDRYSFDALKELLGDAFDESRHLQGVDMAFNLRAIDPRSKLDDEVRGWIEQDPKALVIGLNVSGLIALDAGQARRRFGLRVSYLDVLARFVETVLRDESVRLLLIPHVMTPFGTPGSDAEACHRLLAKLSSRASSRVRVTPTTLDECEVKWLISKMSWFCGTRMHSTIAALSSGVPSAALAYSDKTRGVFESCGVESHVVDPRTLEADDVVHRLVETFEQREDTRRLLALTVPRVKARATEQFAQITNLLRPGT